MLSELSGAVKSKEISIFSFFGLSYLRNWFKGADTVCLLEFLEARIKKGLETIEGDSKIYFHNIWRMVSASNTWMRCIYRSGLFLTCDERDQLLTAGHTVTTVFHKCAQSAFDQDITRWKFMPKFHMFGEILYKLHLEKRCNLPSVNPLAYCTQQDEDFVGRVSTISRSVSVRAVHVRTLSRYLISLASHW